MITDKKVIAIIPARGGSKGLPGKNIRALCGKPLIFWTVQVALKSRLIDELVVSTDDQQIADIARLAGASVPFLRPTEIATDKTPTIDVIDHALDYFSSRKAQTFDYVVWLEPTSPLREDDDIDNMLRKLHASAESFDSIVSVGEVGEHPSIMKKLVGEKIEPFCPELQMTTRRQDNQPAFFPYGVAYVAKAKSLMAERTFYAKRCTYYRIKRYQNYEIDDIYDFLAVENVMRYEWGLE
ncbi:acylneuraminate cytidylyltransferase family protein [Acidobacteria bacterium AH-259-O06]|nr:acylneuraminate cytidylyltransferase family protein [Acidobacteria bacterium AH-259-O06]